MKEMRWAGLVARTGDRNEYKILVGKPDRKRPLRRRRHKWEDNIKMDISEIVSNCGLDSSG
jgi:hypothetical protein